MTARKAIEKATKKMIREACLVCDQYGVAKGADRSTVLRIVLESSGLTLEEEKLAKKIVLREIKRAKDDAVSDKEFARHWGRHD